jgi:hypothetical protein
MITWIRNFIRGLLCCHEWEMTHMGGVNSVFVCRKCGGEDTRRLSDMY